MTLFLTLLPLYLIGNLHCLGMCGPLVMMLAQHRYRHLYFLGRLISFGMAGAIAGEMGVLLHQCLSYYHVPALTCFLFGGLICVIGVYSLGGWHFPGYLRMASLLRNIERKISLLMLRDQPLTTFLFGLFTILLPCGQSLVVFSACALSGSAWVGFVNGLAFSLLTSPSLWLAMRLQGAFRGVKNYYPILMGGFSIIVAVLAFCRGLAEMGAIPHLILNATYHLVLF